MAASFDSAMPISFRLHCNIGGTNAWNRVWKKERLNR